MIITDTDAKRICNKSGLCMKQVRESGRIMECDGGKIFFRQKFFFVSNEVHHKERDKAPLDYKPFAGLKT